ncbi:hypothetical protein M9Y10_024832 [Tritrichomonas musculus]|uniref:CWF21 domain-containing protein n=1 Tax=Tritrichomonas musculus TaxID=1915356 RepID=A0ABR2HBD6_9EUKA
MSSFSLGDGNSNMGRPDFRTDPNLSMEQKREIAGDNYLEAAYEMEKDLERIRASEKKAEIEREMSKNKSDSDIKEMVRILKEWRSQKSDKE